jgi:GAF domain
MRSYTIQLPCIELLAPDEMFHNQDSLKEYSLSYWKDEILRRLIVECSVVNAPSKDGNCSMQSASVTTPCTHDDIGMNTLPKPTSSVTSYSGSPRSVKKAQFKDGLITSPNHSLPKKLDLLNTIARVQRQFFYSESPKVIFGTMLDALLDLLDSEYGFIGEVKYNEDGSKFLQTHSITNIAWDGTTRKFFEDNISNGLAFKNLKSLFGTVLTTAAPVISNDPKTDNRGCGLPKGHPPLDHFLGIPFFMPGGEMNGMVGISNKPGGYSEEDIEFLEVRFIECRYVSSFLSA